VAGRLTVIVKLTDDGTVWLVTGNDSHNYEEGRLGLVRYDAGTGKVLETVDFAQLGGPSPACTMALSSVATQVFTRTGRSAIARPLDGFSGSTWSDLLQVLGRLVRSVAGPRYTSQ